MGANFFRVSIVPRFVYHSSHTSDSLRLNGEVGGGELCASVVDLHVPIDTTLSLIDGFVRASMIFVSRAVIVGWRLSGISPK